MYVKDKSPATKAAPKQQKIRLSFTVIVERDGEHSFHAYCPAFKGLHVDGRTENDAVLNAAKAASVYINSLVANGEPLPIGPHCTKEEEQIPPVPPGALLRYLELQWPSQEMSGIN